MCRSLLLVALMPGLCNGMQIVFRGTLERGYEDGQAKRGPNLPYAKGDLAEVTFTIDGYWEDRRPTAADGLEMWESYCRQYDDPCMYYKLHTAEISGRTYGNPTGWVEWYFDSNDSDPDQVRLSCQKYNDSCWATFGLFMVDGVVDVVGWRMGFVGHATTSMFTADGDHLNVGGVKPPWLAGRTEGEDWFRGVGLRSLPTTWDLSTFEVQPTLLFMPSGRIALDSIQVIHDDLIPGDTNADGTFDQFDVIQVGQAGRYLQGRAAWSEGDWNADGVFDQHDLVLTQQVASYQPGTFAAHIPEPSTHTLAHISLILLGIARRIGGRKLTGLS
jgi:hypothetical protein